MSDRIKELEKQCWDHQTNHLNTDSFAESIIKDIVNIMNDQKTYNRCTYTTHDLDKAHCVVQEIIKCINENFGTEL